MNADCGENGRKDGPLPRGSPWNRAFPLEQRACFETASPLWNGVPNSPYYPVFADFCKRGAGKLSPGLAVFRQKMKNKSGCKENLQDGGSPVSLLIRMALRGLLSCSSEVKRQNDFREFQWWNGILQLIPQHRERFPAKVRKFPAHLFRAVGSIRPDTCGLHSTIPQNHAGNGLQRRAFVTHQFACPARQVLAFLHVFFQQCPIEKGQFPRMPFTLLPCLSAARNRPGLDDCFPPAASPAMTAEEAGPSACLPECTSAATKLKRSSPRTHCRRRLWSWRTGRTATLGRLSRGQNRTILNSEKNEA